MSKSVLVLTAHPDDETLWCGGLLLSHQDWEKTIFSFTRKSDPDRCPKFFKAVKEYGANGIIDDLDDGVEQKPLDYSIYKNSILNNLKKRDYDLIITHSIFGEYSSHLRHEEVSLAALIMIYEGIVKTKELWFFNYTDDKRKNDPYSKEDSDLLLSLSDELFDKKKRILLDVYGFSEDSWEAKIIPEREGFKIKKNFFVKG